MLGFGLAVAFAFALMTRKMSMLVTCGLLAGLFLGIGASANMHAHADALDEDGRHDIALELLEDSRDNGYSERALARIAEGANSGNVVLADFERGCELRFGQLIRGQADFKRFTSRNEEYGWQSGASFEVRVSDARDPVYQGLSSGLLAIRSAAIDAIGSDDDAHALLQALVCGYRRHVRDTEAYACFQTCGLAHLVAVSGAHLVIVTGMFASILRAFRAPRTLSIILIAFVMGSYLVVAGMPVSAIRAVAMSVLGLLSYFGRRRASSMNALGVGIVVMIGMNPAVSVSASFTLSALSTLGIVLFSPLFGHWISLTPLGGVKLAADALSMTLSAGMLSQLYASSLFHQLPIISPLSNMVCAPLFPAVCGLGLVSALLGVANTPFASPLIGVAAGLATVLEKVTGVLAGLPYACVPFALDTGVALLVSGAIAVGLWAMWPCDGRRTGMVLMLALAAAVAFVAFPFGSTQDRIVMLDVGQGDAFLLESRGHTLLIDTGNQDKMLLEELGSLRIAHIDTVLITHADDDHFGSLDVIAHTVDVDRVIVARDMMSCDDESCDQVRTLAREVAGKTMPVSFGDSFSVGGFEARAIWPHAFNDSGGNSDSLCLSVKYDGNDDGNADFTALFTGDAEKDELAEMIANGDIGKVDLLKVGHHGSRNGMTSEEVEALSPKIALIGVGENNRYGHPAPEIVSELEAQGCKVYRSDRDGEVQCVFDAEHIYVTTGM